MSFQSNIFILFCIGVITLYYLLPPKTRNAYLLAVSWLFVFLGDAFGLLWLLLVTAGSYAAGRLIGGAARPEVKKRILIISIVLLAGSLFGFKYLDFAIDTWNLLAARFSQAAILHRTFRMALPIGISYYTFAVLGYLIDVARSKIAAQKNFLRFALFVGFFPQIIQGPIGRADLFLPQTKQGRQFSWDSFLEGFIRVIYGYFLKMVVADHAAVAVNTVFTNPEMYGGGQLWIGAFMFTIQIYTDFAGYTNIALGLAQILGFSIPENFNAPYLATSIADFWRRWHMSLTGWFRDYLYIPLGGNRKGRFRKYLNIMIVFLVSGLWHGAQWHFVFWGAVNGLYQVVGDVLRPVRKGACRVFGIDEYAGGHRLTQWITTFFLVNISWVFFRADDTKTAFGMLRRMLIPEYWDLGRLTVPGDLAFGLNYAEWNMLFLALLLVLVIDLFHYRNIYFRKILLRQSVWFQYACILVLLFWTLICGKYGSAFNAADFIYTSF